MNEENEGNGIGVQTLNPWISMWTKPRETIQQIVASDPERLVLLLAAVVGVSNFLDRAATQEMGERIELPLILTAALIAGPIFGLISLYVGSLLLRWTGGWLGGTADYRNIRAAMAWANVPVIWALPLVIPQLALFGSEVFMSEKPNIGASGSLTAAYIGFRLIDIVIALWTLVLFLQCLGQVQGFSAWKALGNMLLSALMVAIPVALITYMLGTGGA